MGRDFKGFGLQYKYNITVSGNYFEFTFMCNILLYILIKDHTALRVATSRPGGKEPVRRPWCRWTDDVSWSRGAWFGSGRQIDRVAVDSQ